MHRRVLVYQPTVFDLALHQTINTSESLHADVHSSTADQCPHKGASGAQEFFQTSST